MKFVIILHFTNLWNFGKVIYRTMVFLPNGNLYGKQYFKSGMAFQYFIKCYTSMSFE